jgi:hypothetical protein
MRNEPGRNAAPLNTARTAQRRAVPIKLYQLTPGYGIRLSVAADVPAFPLV